jgi:predicted enzyme related to lactoylglutathione lyase
VNDPGSLTMTELATPDPDRAAAFYEALLGWTTEVVDQASGYRSLKVGERLNAGMRPDTSMPANWVPYFTVASLDDAPERARSSGGAVVVEPVTIPAGRFAGLADPQGAVFCPFEGEVDD